MTKREAIVATMGAVIGLMSNRVKTSELAPTSSFTITNMPQSVSFSFDTFEKFTFSHSGESITLTGKEMFDALKLK